MTPGGIDAAALAAHQVSVTGGTLGFALALVTTKKHYSLCNRLILVLESTKVYSQRAHPPKKL
jgi:hypothetical protein